MNMYVRHPESDTPFLFSNPMFMYHRIRDIKFAIEFQPTKKAFKYEDVMSVLGGKAASDKSSEEILTMINVILNVSRKLEYINLDYSIVVHYYLSNFPFFLTVPVNYADD